MPNVESPMPGKVWQVNVKVGDNVSADDVVLVLEAMKMEIEIAAQEAGVVKEINANIGDSVEAGDVLITLE